ncbi:MAG: hypothetical protein AAGA60_26775 [Cyanobacteria bacterium P01_E01_bin.42]
MAAVEAIPLPAIALCPRKVRELRAKYSQATSNPPTTHPKPKIVSSVQSIM